MIKHFLHKMASQFNIFYLCFCIPWSFLHFTVFNFKHYKLLRTTFYSGFPIKTYQFLHSQIPVLRGGRRGVHEKYSKTILLQHIVFEKNAIEKYDVISGATFFYYYWRHEHWYIRKRNALSPCKG